ncbi:hypothetical protein M0811_08127 [Anaeramoeba ignava]|uniref:Transmembrane protein n=1 Tax=Anaeramoeba ignava TaxID=1746090 RepID=A0A9Q0RB83_ANAIG|nr:hypothetical protein M0811_08127 [Anaeramoeba ignava]
MSFIIYAQTPQNCAVAFKDENGNYHNYDFSSLMRTKTEDPYILSDSEQKIIFLFNICANITNILDCYCCVPDLTTGYVISGANLSTCTDFGYLKNYAYQQITQGDLEDGISLIYTIGVEPNIEKFMQINFFCNNYETFRVVTAYYHDTDTVLNIEIDTLTKLTCFSSTPSPIIESCSKCNAAGASFGVIASLFFGVFTGFYFYKWRKNDPISNYQEF